MSRGEAHASFVIRYNLKRHALHRINDYPVEDLGVEVRNMSYLSAPFVGGIRSFLLVHVVIVARLGEGTKLINVYKRSYTFMTTPTADVHERS